MQLQFQDLGGNMSKKKFNRYSIKDMLNEKKAVGYFPGMYLVYDIPDRGPDGKALDAEDELEAKNAAFGSLKQRIADKIEDITRGKIYGPEAEQAFKAMEKMGLQLDPSTVGIDGRSLGSVILGDENERILADLDDGATQEEKDKRAAQREDVEEVLGKSAGRLKQLQQIFISLLGKQEGNKKFGILLNVIGHPGGPAVESKSTVDGEDKLSPAPDAKMKNGFLDKSGFPNIFFQAFKNVTAEDLQKIGALNSFKDLEGETATGEFWTAMYKLAGGNQPAVGIGEIYAALRCNGVQGDDSGSGPSVDVISHVNGESLNNKKLGAQGATTKALFCEKVKEIIEDGDINIAGRWPDFKLLVESFGLHNDSAPSSLSPEDVMARMAECRIGGVEKAKKIIKSADYAGTFNHPIAAIVAQEGMAYIFHEATTREINAKSIKGIGAGKTVYTSWQDGMTFTEIREATSGNVCLPVAGIGSGRVSYNRGGYFKLLPNQETTSKAWLEKVNLEKFAEAAKNPSDVKYNSSTFPEIEVPQLGNSNAKSDFVKIQTKLQKLQTDGFKIAGETYKLERNITESTTWSKTCYDASSSRSLSGEYTKNPFIGYVVRKNDTELTVPEKVALYNSLPPKSKKGIPVGQNTIRLITITMPYKIAKGRKALVMLGANSQIGGSIDDEQIIKLLNSIEKKTITKNVYSAWLETPGLNKTEVPGFTETANEALTAGKIYKKSILEVWDLLP